MRVPLVSVVIPAFNEAACLPRLLASLDRARRAYRGDASDIEIVVADNLSTDDTAGIARSRGCEVAYAVRRRIGAARNAGARAAHGAILAFVDADFQVHEQSFNAIADFFARPARWRR